MANSPLLHSYPWYISDWLGSETRFGMNTEERAIYRDLLDHCWQHGSLPTDTRVLSAMSAVTLHQFNRAWPKVGAKFFERGGRYFNEKVNEKRDSVLRAHEQRSIAGRASVEARRQRSFNGRSADVQTAFEPSSTTTIAVPTSEKETPLSGCKEKSPQPRFAAPTPDEVRDYGKSIDFQIDGEKFCDFYASKGWMIGKNAMKDWKAAVRTWRTQERSTPTPTAKKTASERLMERLEREEREAKEYAN